VVLAFGVPLSSHVEKVADEHGVKVQIYDVIYSLLDDVQALILGLLEPEEKETTLGHLEIKGCFFAKHAEQTVGGKVLDGVIKRARFRLLREGKEIGHGRVTSLRHIDRDIKEAKEGTECGLKVDSEVQIQMGDTLEVFNVEFRKKTT
jgi:translation initiation factor IF-2